MTDRPVSADDRVPMTDEELAEFLGIAKAKERDRLMAAITPEHRKMYEQMKFVEQEVNAGRLPANVIVCREHKHHKVFGRG